MEYYRSAKLDEKVALHLAKETFLKTDKCQQSMHFC